MIILLILNMSQNSTKHFWSKVPKRTKFKRLHKGRINGFEYNTKRTNICYGSFGLKILKPIRLTQAQITSIRTTISRRKLLKKKQHTLWIRGLFDIPVSKKPNEIRMGKGKGAVHHWIMRVKPGKILFEVSSMSYYKAKRIFEIIKSALGIPGQMICLKTYSKKFRIIK